jgi:chromosome segregation ATPase
VIPEEEEEEAAQRDTNAERRARRAWLGDAVLLRRAEAAEASLRSLEAQLAERELELRRVKQREHAEQQLRVEAEEVAVRARSGHRAELDRWQRRLDTAHAATKRVQAQRDTLAAELAAVSASAERLEGSIHALQLVAAELRTSVAREHADSRARIAELEVRLERLRARRPAAPVRPDAEDRSEIGQQRREEMTSALAAAVTRLRSRPVGLEQPATPPPEPVSTAEPTAAASAQPLASRAPQVRPAEVSTVIVVPRLFAGGGRSGGRLAPVARRVAVRLARWADRASGLSR